MPEVEMQDVAGGGRICFRGDSRDPSTIFREGFHSRDPNSKIKYARPSPAPMFIHAEHERHYQAGGFQTTTGKTLAHAAPTPVEAYRTALRGGGAAKGQSIALVPRTPDANSLTAVCVTPHFAMAVLFPPKAQPSDTVPEYSWVYTVFVRQLYNTHAQQVSDGLRAIEKELAVRDRIATDASSVHKVGYGGASLLNEYAESVALWPLYAQELATKFIEPKDVICAIKVRRIWKGDDWTYGCDYELAKKTLKFNRLCTVDKSLRKVVKQFLKAEPDKGTTPSRASGFHKDTETTRVSINVQKLAAMILKMVNLPDPRADQSDVLDSEWLD